MPAADFVYADVDGHVGSQRAGLIPVRAGGRGVSVSAGWTGVGDWRTWQSLDRLAHELDPPRCVGGRGAIERCTPSPDRRAAGRGRTGTGSRALRIQRDVVVVECASAHAASQRAVGERSGSRLRAARGCCSGTARLPPTLVTRCSTSPGRTRYCAGWRQPACPHRSSPSSSPDEQGALVSALLEPSKVWFDGDDQKVPLPTRDALLVEALAQAVDDARRWAGADSPDATWGRFNVATFMHPSRDHRASTAPVQRWPVCAVRDIPRRCSRPSVRRSSVRWASVRVRRRSRGLGSVAGHHGAGSVRGAR